MSTNTELATLEARHDALREELFAAMAVAESDFRALKRAEAAAIKALPEHAAYYERSKPEVKRLHDLYRQSQAGLAAARGNASIAAIGDNRPAPRYYAESDGEPHAKTFYVCHTHGRPRIDCKSMVEARNLADALNTKEYFAAAGKHHEHVTR